MIFSKRTGVDQLRNDIVAHLALGKCANVMEGLLGAPACHCVNICVAPHPSLSDVQLWLLSSVHSTVNSSTCRKILAAVEVGFEPTGSLGKLRRKLRSYLSRLKCGKMPEYLRDREPMPEEAEDACLTQVHDQWPHPVSELEKERMIRNSWKETSSNNLRFLTCACCSGNIVQ